jgi:hypothetical protein
MLGFVVEEFAAEKLIELMGIEGAEWRETGDPRSMDCNQIPRFRKRCDELALFSGLGCDYSGRRCRAAISPL